MAHVTRHPGYNQYRMKVGQMPDFSGANDVIQEEPLGLKDGQNKIFVLARNQIRGSEKVYKNGLYMRKGVDHDYVIVGKEITFTEAPSASAVILVDYKYME